MVKYVFSSNSELLSQINRLYEFLQLVILEKFSYQLGLHIESFFKMSYKLCLDIGSKIDFLLATMQVQIYKHDVGIGIRQVYTWYYLRSLPRWYWYKVGSASIHPGLLGSLILVLGLYHRSNKWSEGVNWCWLVIDLFFHNFNPF